LNTDIYILHYDTGISWRGGQHQVLLLMRELKRRGVKQALAAPEKSPLWKKARELEVERFSLNASSDIDVFAAVGLRKAVKSRSPDIVHLHTGRALGIACWALRGIKNVKTVFTRRVDFPLKNNFLNRYKYGFPAAVVAISSLVEENLKNFGRTENVEKIYSCVDTDKFKPLSGKYESGRIRVGMAGALSLGHKDYETFVKTAEIVSRSHPEVSFEIAGEGDGHRRIKKMIKDRGLEDKVFLKGFVEDISGFIASLDILLHTAHYEGLGTVILQALACGVPVVASRVGGIPEIINHGFNGYLTEKNSPGETSSKVLVLINDSTKRKEMGMSGRKSVKRKFSPEVMASKYLDLYKRVKK